jgi:hypothetical protein
VDIVVGVVALVGVDRDGDGDVLEPGGRLSDELSGNTLRCAADIGRC